MAWHSEGHRPSSRDMLAELEAAEIRRRAAERNACDDIASGEVWPVELEELLEAAELADFEPVAEPRPVARTWRARGRQDRGMDPGLFC